MRAPPPGKNLPNPQEFPKGMEGINNIGPPLWRDYFKRATLKEGATHKIMGKGPPKGALRKDGRKFGPKGPQ